MIQVELAALLESTGYPIAYGGFQEATNPPYIAYLRVFDNNISSDQKVHGKIKTYNVELYTDKKDLIAERKLETVLNNIDAGYETSETYIESESLYQVVYQIKIIERG